MSWSWTPWWSGPAAPAALRIVAEVVAGPLNAAYASLPSPARAPGQLLDARVTVQLERIELGFLPWLDLMAVQDLGLCLDLEFTQLVAKADDSLVELVKVELDLRELLGQAGISNADLAGAVEELLQQARVHTRKVPGLNSPITIRRQAGRFHVGRREPKEFRRWPGRWRRLEFPCQFAQALQRGRNGRC